MDFAYDSPTPILKCFFFCISTFEIFFNVGCESTIIYLVHKYKAKDIATQLKDAKCFSVGMGSDTVYDVHTNIDKVVAFGYVEIGLSVASAVVQVLALLGEWRNAVGDSQEHAQYARVPMRCRGRLGRIMGILMIPIFGFLFSIIEVAIALFDYFENVEPLYQAFITIMASFGGAPLPDSGVACVSTTAEAVQLVKK